MSKAETNTQATERQRRFAPATGGPGGRHGGRFVDKPKVKNVKGTTLRLLGYLKNVKFELMGAMLALLGATMATLIAPRLSGKLIDLLNGTFELSPSLVAASVFGVYSATGLFMSRRLNGAQPGEFKKLAIEGLIFSAVNFATVSAGVGTAVYITSDTAGAELAKLLATLGCLYIGSTLMSLVQQLLLVRVSQHTVRILRKELFDRLQTLPLRFFDATPHGELMSRLSNDVDNVSNMLSNTLTQVFSSIITLAVCLYMMLTLSWQLTLVSFITIPFSLLIMRVITRYTRVLFKKQQACLGELNGIVEETVTGARVVKVFCREDNVISEFMEANRDLTKTGTKATILSSLIGPCMNVINNIAYALMSGIGGFLVVNGSVASIGMIQSFLQYSRQFANPFNQIANQITAIQSALAGAERVFEVMDTPPEPVDEENAKPLTSPRGHVVFEDVTFGYSPESPVLKHLSFEARPGQAIALVGPTGAGKTTVVNLLMRFYDIDSGTILIDGVNISDVRRQDLRASLGMVLQDVYLFAGTVRDNIAYGRLDATDEEIEAAAKMANCHAFITRLPNGYNTLLTEAGSNLSQGQRQLMSIARAILANPAVLILDEATSSVDTRTEMNIQQAMLALMKGRTSFVIAHRLSTIRNADLILVIDGGEIIERGTHEELISQGGFYANLLNSQYRSGVIEESEI